ncbi:MAG: hypothetical protein Q9170_001637 [Blastenia crenularia]
MSVYRIAIVAAAFAALSGVSAHGMVSGIVAEGHYPGYTIGFAYTPKPPPVVAWSIPEDKDTGFVNPGNYSNPDIICHKGATPAQEYVTVAAGGSVELQWTKWPESHHGPVLDYLANCNGECTSVDKTKLQFNKIDELGLLEYQSMPGSWASDKLIAANNSWTVTVPKSVAPGNYVLRHEIIALHSAQNPDGAQNYPQCVNLKVTGSGSDKLASGTLGTSLYTPTDAGIAVNIYQKLTYSIPGPKLYSGTSSGTATSAYSVSPSITSSNGGYGAVPTSGTSSTPTYAPTSATPYPTGSIGNLTSTVGKSGKGHKKPCSTAAYNVPKKAHDGPGVNSQQSSTTLSTPTTSKAAVVSITPATSTLESILPTSVLTAPITSVTASHSSTSENETGSLAQEPKHQLPEGMTVQELLEWLEIIVAQLEVKMGGKVRRHAREFLRL